MPSGAAPATLVLGFDSVVIFVLIMVFLELRMAGFLAPETRVRFPDAGLLTNLLPCYPSLHPCPRGSLPDMN